MSFFPFWWLLRLAKRVSWFLSMYNAATGTGPLLFHTSRCSSLAALPLFLGLHMRPSHCIGISFSGVLRPQIIYKPINFISHNLAKWALAITLVFRIDPYSKCVPITNLIIGLYFKGLCVTATFIFLFGFLSAVMLFLPRNLHSLSLSQLHDHIPCCPIGQI